MHLIKSIINNNFKLSHQEILLLIWRYKFSTCFFSHIHKKGTWERGHVVPGTFHRAGTPPLGNGSSSSWSRCQMWRLFLYASLTGYAAATASCCCCSFHKANSGNPSSNHKTGKYTSVTSSESTKQNLLQKAFPPSVPNKIYFLMVDWLGFPVGF